MDLIRWGFIGHGAGVLCLLLRIIIMNDQNADKAKEELLNEQESLINLIKAKYPTAYKWFLENNIKLREIQKYSVNIALALSILFGVVYGSVPSIKKFPTIPAPTELTLQQVKIINSEEFKGLNETQKSELIWERYGNVINGAAIKYDIDPKVIFATIMIESGGNTYAKRYEPSIHDASYGLGQILYGTARLIGFEGKPEDLYDPVTNIDLVGRYHRKNLDTYGNALSVEQLSTAYNSGSPYIRAYPGYINKFIRWYEKAKNLVVS